MSCLCIAIVLIVGRRLFGSVLVRSWIGHIGVFFFAFLAWGKILELCLVLDFLIGLNWARGVPVAF